MDSAIDPCASSFTPRWGWLARMARHESERKEHDGTSRRPAHDLELEVAQLRVLGKAHANVTLYCARALGALGRAMIVTRTAPHTSRPVGRATCGPPGRTSIRGFFATSRKPSPISWKIGTSAHSKYVMQLYAPMHTGSLHSCGCDD
jgi:hypothetical protein